MAFFYAHAGLMTGGFLLMATGVTAALFFRRKRWWLKVHRYAGLTGVCAFFLGVVMAFLMVAQAGEGHLKMPHAWLGAAVLLLAVITPVLGQLQFRWKEKAQQIRALHRWSGRLTLAAAALNLFSGLWLAGII
jgi:hypothetical protein